MSFFIFYIFIHICIFCLLKIFYILGVFYNINLYHIYNFILYNICCKVKHWHVQTIYASMLI